MNKEAFRLWLTSTYRTRTGQSLNIRTIDSRIANCVTVERTEGDLDGHFDRDGMRALLNRLDYRKHEERQALNPTHQIPVEGDIYEGTATLKSAVKLYKRFREEIREKESGLDVTPETLLTNELSEFFRRASFYRYHNRFDNDERLYKIRLSNAFAQSRSLITTNPKHSLFLFRQALKSRDNNIIDWRQHRPLLKWLSRDPDDLLDNLATLWDETIPLNLRVESFCEALNRNEISQTGSHLAIVSTLLMTLSTNDYPPVKTESFSSAMRLAGWKAFSANQTAFEKYTRAIEFLDFLRRVSVQFDVELRDRLDAQAVVWCVSGGWPNLPVPGSWKNDPEDRSRTEQLIYAIELNQLGTEPGSSHLTDTQKLTLVKARRGQAWFREQLIKLWSCCSVTECADLIFLRASHIRPWDRSTNEQRLDPYNGFLLSPNLDIAFDAGLITFRDDGQIEISDQLDSKHRKLLGIHSKLRLRHVDDRHRPYLIYHRTEIFKQKPKRKTTGSARKSNS